MSLIAEIIESKIWIPLVVLFSLLGILFSLVLHAKRQSDWCADACSPSAVVKCVPTGAVCASEMVWVSK